MIFLRIAIVFALVSFVTPVLEAQRRAPHTIARGERARLILPRGWRSSQVAIGTVDFVSSDSIALQSEGDGALFATPAKRGMRVDVSRGPGDPQRGAAFGALTGLLAGVLIGYVAGEDCGAESFVCFDRSETVPGFALGGMIAGAAVGALMRTGERWERARMPAAAREARFGPAGRGLGVRIALQAGL